MATILLFSCSKNDSNSNIENNSNPPHKSVSADSVGILHNMGLDYIIERYNSQSNNLDSIFNNVNTLQKAFFLSEGYAQSNLPTELKELVSSGDGISWLNDLCDNNIINISSNLKGYLVNILTYTYNGSNTPFSQSDYYSYLDSVYNAAALTLGENELEMLETHISVAKYSFEYWFNSNGTPKEILHGASRSINWWQTLGADCLGGIVTCGDPAGFVGASAFDIYYQIV